MLSLSMHHLHKTVRFCGTTVALCWAALTFAADTKPLTKAPSEDLLLWLIEMDIQTKDDIESMNAVMLNTKDAEKSSQATPTVNEHQRFITRKNGVSHE